MNVRKNIPMQELTKELTKEHTDILKFVKEISITTTSEVAEKFDLSWNTAEKRLLELVIEGKVEKIKKAGVNLWVLTK